jgi:hypothetical protein
MFVLVSLLPEQNVTFNRFHMCTISTHNDGCLSVPDLSVQFPLHC